MTGDATREGEGSEAENDGRSTGTGLPPHDNRPLTDTAVGPHRGDGLSVVALQDHQVLADGFAEVISHGSKWRECGSGTVEVKVGRQEERRGEER